ncbi:hypothetical protein Ciccas_008092 [Cichlidogyrus casuarinus]|uniref:Uncharacterized protein n=1 Tax=Cichlidogyrus casuarinus TaxID=1844966 RepID=A0ABD2Q0Z1_9PLAT
MKFSMSEGIRRRHIVKEESSDGPNEPDKVASNQQQEEEIDYSDKEMRLTLMEEVLLIGLKDQNGYTSFWNDKISAGLRGCILIELAFRDRIALEGPSHQGIYRPVVVKSTAPTGDQLLDEAIRTINSSLKNQPIARIIEYLSGESWNFLMMSSQMRNVRERVAKSLVEKGILTTEKANYIVVDFTTHPLVKYETKRDLLKRVHQILLSHWPADPSRLSKHNLALVLLAHFSDVLEDGLTVLPDVDYSLAMRHVDQLANLNYSQLGSEDSKFAVMWGVFHSLAKN